MLKTIRLMCLGGFGLLLGLAFFAAPALAKPLDSIAYARTPYAAAAGILLSRQIINPQEAAAPEALMTRQATALLLGKTVAGPRFEPEKYQSAITFTDLPDNPQLQGYIYYCADSGIISGIRENTFVPGQVVTQAEYCRMLATLWRLNDADPTSTNVPAPDLFSGMALGADQPLTRETACLLLQQLLFSPHAGLGADMNLASKYFYNPYMPDLFDVVYIPGSDNPKHRLDVYYPQGPAPKDGWPTLIIAHGGGFARGDKFGNRLNVTSFKGLEHGYAVILISYRLTNEATAPAQILDAKAAVAFLRQNAAALKLNAAKFVMVGYSAGANLAALVATSAGNERFTPSLRALGAVNAYDHVAAAVGFYGPYNYASDYFQYVWLTGGENHAYDREYAPYQKQRTAFNAAYDLPEYYDADWESPLFSKRLSQAQDMIDLINPATYAKSDNAPLLLLHGEMDQSVPFLQSVELAAALEKAGAAVELVLVPEVGHGTDLTEVYDMEQIFKWLAQVPALKSH